MYPFTLPTQDEHLYRDLGMMGEEFSLAFAGKDGGHRPLDKKLVNPAPRDPDENRPVIQMHFLSLRCVTGACPHSPGLSFG